MVVFPADLNDASEAVANGPRVAACGDECASFAIGSDSGPCSHLFGVVHRCAEMGLTCADRGSGEQQQTGANTFLVTGDFVLGGGV